MKRPIQLAACVLAVSVSGCSHYTQVQHDLVTQARRGVALATESQSNNASAVSELARLRRQRLDAAFDADVVDQGQDLNADWVVEARKAYGAVLDAYAKEQAATAKAQNAARRNLHDVDAALARVQSLQSTQLKLTQPIEKLLTSTDTKENQP